MSMKDISVGRRKASVARVRFVKGKGKIFVNNRDPLEYFKRESLVMDFKQPLKLVDFDYPESLIPKLQKQYCQFV